MNPDAELDLTLAIPQQVTVVTCRLKEGVSELTHAALELATTEHLHLEDVLERDATIRLAPEGFSPRLWTLRVGHLDFNKITTGSLRYTLNLYPAFWLLRFTTNTRKFRNKSSEQIIGSILSEHQIKHRFNLTRPTETRKYCAQYRETNLAYVSRLLEWEGIYYYFEPDGTMVMADRSPASAPVAGVSTFELNTAEGALNWGSVGLFAFKKGRRVASGKSTVGDYNWKKPKVTLRASSAGDADHELEVYNYPEGYRRPEQGGVIAQRRVEALRIGSHYVEGSGNVTSFEPARLFAFGSLVNARFAGDYLLRRVEHVYFNRKFNENDAGIGTEVNYRNHFEAIPKDTPFRPALDTPYPEIAGCHTAMVRGPSGEEIHTDTHGRYRAQFHWDREATGTDEDSRWLRNTQEVATGMVLARVGWEQSIAYVNGDPDRPFGFARNINGQMTPEYSQPSGKTRMSIKTPTYPGGGGFNELRLEDAAGSQHMDWKAERDHLNQVDNDRSEKIGGKETRNVHHGFAWTVGNDQDVEITGNMEVGVGAGCQYGVEKDRTKKVTGNEEMQITAVYGYSIEGNDKEEVTGTYKILAAEKNGAITRSISKTLKRTIEGDHSIEGDGNLEHNVQDDVTITIGETRTVECESGAITFKVGGEYKVDVEGKAVRKAKKDMGFSAEDTKVTVDKKVTFHGKERIAINGDEILMEAKKCLELKSGDLLIRLEPGKATLKGNMKLDGGTTIDVTGTKLNLT